jgi:DNA-binding MarR family transcriptional regulator
MPSVEELGLAIKRLQWRHHREGNRRLTSGAGLSLVQWDVLRRLQREPDASLHALAEATFQTDQSMGELAKRMTAAGLLRRVEGPGRAVRHVLTAEGEAAYRAGASIFLEVLNETVGRLSEQDRDQLLDLLQRATPE